jgi:hypothetical protein
VLIQRLVEVMQERSAEGNATDLSRLGWLLMHLGSFADALKVAERGLAADEQNEHCRGLYDRALKARRG